MGLLARYRSAVRVSRFLAALPVLFLLGSSTFLFANTTPLVPRAKPATCYCRCANSRAHKDCIKMCELPKYASRWWAKTCVKPRLKPPVDNKDAGPHLHHPDHAERASL